MRANKKKVACPVDVPVMPKKGKSLSQSSKPVKRTRRQCQKPTGEIGGFLLPKDKSPLPSITARVAKALPGLEHNPINPLPSRKIKLQLFPVDENTRRGLEKDGCHPYLELILSARKKISSVLKHLNAKWGRSSIAVGQPTVFPYHPTKELLSCRWTSNDTDVCAEDIFIAVGRPSIFRLRYGWLADSETRSHNVGSLSTKDDACLQLAEAEKYCNKESEIIDVEGNEIEEMNVETEVAISSGPTSDMNSSNTLVEQEGSRSRADVGAGQSSVPWDDGMTNISIGGLLSEASLQGKLPRSDPQTNGSSSTFFSDSFDAFLAAQTSSSSRPRLFPPGLNSSILNAEDTCQAFSFQTFASSCKKSPTIGTSAFQKGSNEDVVKPVWSQPSIPDGQRNHESETDMPVCPVTGAHNDESSLGLSSIKWTESLGPFDLGLSSSRKIIHSDSISLGRIFS